MAAGRRPWIVPIPATAKLERPDENLGANAMKPTAEDRQELESAVAKIKVQGVRYPEHLQKPVGR